MHTIWLYVVVFIDFIFWYVCIYIYQYIDICMIALYIVYCMSALYLLYIVFWKAYITYEFLCTMVCLHTFRWYLALWILDIIYYILDIRYWRFDIICRYTYIYYILYTSSTAQDGGGSFKDRKTIGRLVAVNDGPQSEPTNGPTSGWRQRSLVVVVIVVEI